INGFISRLIIDWPGGHDFIDVLASILITKLTETIIVFRTKMTSLTLGPIRLGAMVGLIWSRERGGLGNTDLIRVISIQIMEIRIHSKVEVITLGLNSSR